MSSINIESGCSSSRTNFLGGELPIGTDRFIEDRVDVSGKGTTLGMEGVFAVLLGNGPDSVVQALLSLIRSQPRTSADNLWIWIFGQSANVPVAQ